MRFKTRNKDLWGEYLTAGSERVKIGDDGTCSTENEEVAARLKKVGFKAMGEDESEGASGASTEDPPKDPPKSPDSSEESSEGEGTEGNSDEDSSEEKSGDADSSEGSEDTDPAASSNGSAAETQVGGNELTHEEAARAGGAETDATGQRLFEKSKRRKRTRQ